MLNNDLVPVKDNIFSKIKTFFKQLFEGEESTNTYENNTVKQINEGSRNENFSKNIRVEESENEKLLKLQKMIRDKKVTEDELSHEEISKLRELYKKQIDELKTSILQKRNKIMKIKYKQKRKAHASN